MTGHEIDRADPAIRARVVAEREFDLGPPTEALGRAVRAGRWHE